MVSGRSFLQRIPWVLAFNDLNRDRFVPSLGGPFQLEYMRHTGQWLSMFGVRGDIEAIAKFIDEDAYYGKAKPFE